VGCRLSRSSVLIISDDPEFARTIAASWQTGRHVPEITLATSDVWHPSGMGGGGVVIVGPVRNGRSEAILSALKGAAGTALISVMDDEKTCALRQAEHPHATFIPRQDGWIASLMAISGEALRRVEAVGRAQRAERMALENQKFATLGRYMLEMRPSVNNALTSVLGNADLLVVDPSPAREDWREQIETIHAMALRLNEIMQRFSSLASEIRTNEKESQAETGALAEHLVEGPWI
jgi:signal transduction histidine kinase